MVRAAIYNKTNGEIRVIVQCAEEQLLLQDFDEETEDVIELPEGDDVEFRIIVPEDGSLPYPERRTDEEIEERRPKPSAQLTVEKLLAILQAKGIEITDEDLA